MLSSVEHEIFPLIYVEMPIIVGILPCMSGKNNILGLTGPGAGGANFLVFLYLLAFKISCSAGLSMKRVL